MPNGPATHAVRMDMVYQSQRHIYDLTRKYYLLGRDRLIDRLAPPAAGTVLEVGCGTGRNLILAARRWPDAQFFGIDISRAMLETAQANIAREGLTGKIHLAAADATRFDPEALFGRVSFERIFQSYTLSMIPAWEAAISEAVNHLSDDGQLHIVDFGQQERLPRLFRSALMHWLARFHVKPRAELEQAARRSAGPRALRFDYLYRGYAWAAEIG